MTIFLYRWKIKPGFEKQFEENWSIITIAMREHCGSYGSRLHRAENGEYIGYAQWPDADTRENCKLDSFYSQAQNLMREAVVQSYPSEQLEIKDDFLIRAPS
jgi:hypothetical protein